MESLITNTGINVNGYVNQEVKDIIHVEILQSPESALSQDAIRQEVSDFLLKEDSFSTECILSKQDFPQCLRSDIESIRINREPDGTPDKKHVATSNVQLVDHIYQLESSGPDLEELPGADTDQECIPAATQWLLPSSEFHNLWDTLIYDTDIKEQLLRFVSTALVFADHGVDSNIISWNRVVLLHGPPGTGKTSLCKALAQKLSIRLGDRYSYGQLVEINSHSLFSKWFSESGKLVQQLFTRLQEMVEDRSALVCVLIDEVESLARSRCSAAAGTEPGDAVRVVNALLTQLDRIKRYPNVLILTTSNISGTVDLAFVDRADIKHFVGLPSQGAIYQIYHSCISELAKVGLISEYEPCHLLTLRQLQITNMVENEATKASLVLWDIAKCSDGISGRGLRKLPFLAHALQLRRPPNTLATFLASLRQAVETHKKDEKLVAGNS